MIEVQRMKDDKKYIYVVAVLLLVVVALGISYAWFSAIITGNDTEMKYHLIMLYQEIHLQRK